MAETVTKKHPVRAAVWGFVAGLGVAMLLTVAWPIIALESISQVVTQWVIVIVIVMVLSILWGSFGPAKKPKGPAPAPAQPMEPAAQPMAPAEPATEADMDADDMEAGEMDSGPGDSMADEDS